MTKVAMMIAPDILLQFFNGKSEDKDASKVLKLLSNMGDNNEQYDAFTPLSSFLNAIWKADNKVSIQNIQRSLTFLNVLPSFANFKDDEAVKNELIKIAKIFGGENA